jgi:tetratricopeptide (TPR) repeat protein
MEPGKPISHYELAEKLGEGGMGEVYKAWDVRLKRPVALKFLRSSLCESPEQLARFQQEAQVVAALNHPNIATIHEINQAEGRHFLAFEYLPGGTLKSALDQLRAARQQISLEQGLDYAVQLAEALAYAHSQGVVHRDIKTANVMFTDAGTLKLTDFGLARSGDGNDVTQTGTILGTPATMSPEQAQGLETDARSDVFSLGVVLFEMFSGGLPFKGEKPAAVMYQVVHQPAPPLSRFCPGVPVGLEQIVAQALQKNPADRYQTAAGLAWDLRALRRDIVAGNTTTRTALETVLMKDSRIILGWRHWPLKKLAALAVCLGIAVAGLDVWFAWPDQEARLAVMPFTDVEGNEKDQVALTGFRELLVGRLSSVERPGGLLVVAPSPEEVKAKDIARPEQAGTRLAATLVMSARLVHVGQQQWLTVHLQDPRYSWDVRAVSIDVSGGDWGDAASQVVQMLKFGIRARVRLALIARNYSKPGAVRFYIEGSGLLHNDQPEAAERAFRDAVKLDSKYALGWAGLAETLYQEYRRQKNRMLLEEASKDAGEALKADSRLAEAHITLGHVQLAQGNRAEAERELKAALKLEPSNATAYQALGEVYHESNDYESALATYKRAIIMRPDDPNGHNHLGYFYEQQDKLPDAERSFLEAIRLAPESYVAHYNLGTVYGRMERYREAFEHLERSLLIAPSVYGYNNLGTLYYYTRQYKKAAEKYEQARVLAPNNYEVMGDLGDAYRWDPEQGKNAPLYYFQAIEMLKREITAKPGSALLHAQLAQYYVSIRDPEPLGVLGQANRRRAIEEIETALDLGASRPVLQLYAAEVYEQVGDRKRALKAVERAMEAGNSAMFYIKKAPELEQLRADPEFVSIRDHRGVGEGRK